MKFFLPRTTDILQGLRPRIRRAQAEIMGLESPFAVDREAKEVLDTVSGFAEWFDSGYFQEHFTGMVENPFDWARWSILRDEMMERGNEVGAVALNFIWHDWKDPRNYLDFTDRIVFRYSCFFSARATANAEEMRETIHLLEWREQFFEAFLFLYYQVLNLQLELTELEKYQTRMFADHFDLWLKNIDFATANLLHFRGFDGFDGKSF